MKVAYFLPHLVPGGITRSTPALAEQFIHNGHSVDFLSISIHPDTRDEITQLGINVIDLNASRTILAIPKLARYLKNENPDILLSAQHYANLVSVWARSLSRQPIPLILTERLAIAEALKYDSPYKRPFMKRLIKLFYPRAEAVVAISHEGARQLEQINNWKPNTVHAIYNATPIEKIKSLAQQPIQHKWLKQPRDFHTLVSVGRLEFQKGFDVLIRAFSMIPDNPKFRLIIIGDGTLKPQLQNLISELNLNDYIEITGYLPNPYPYIKNSDLFVSASHYEGLGNTLIEAQVCQTPVVATDCPVGPNEILLNGNAGVLTPVNNPNALANAIHKTLTNPQTLAKINTEAQKNLHRFSAPQIYQQYQTLIAKLV